MKNKLSKLAAPLLALTLAVGTADTANANTQAPPRPEPTINLFGTPVKRSTFGWGLVGLGALALASGLVARANDPNREVKTYQESTYSESAELV